MAKEKDRDNDDLLIQSGLRDSERSDQAKKTTHKFDKKSKKIYSKAERTELLLLSTKKEVFGNEEIFSFFEKIKSGLEWLSLATYIIAIPIYAFKAYHDAIHAKKDKYSRAVMFGMDCLGGLLAGLGVVAIVGLAPVGMPILIVASAAKSLIEKGLLISKLIHTVFFSKDHKKEIKVLDEKITTLKNKIKQSPRYLNQGSPEIKELRKLMNNKNKPERELARETHHFAESGVALVGAGLLFTPAFPIGAAILIGVGLYGIFDAFNVNPFTLMARGINFLSKKIRGKPLFNNPLPTKKSIEEVVEDLKKEIEIDKKNGMQNAGEHEQPQPNPKPKLIHNSELDIVKIITAPNDPHQTLEGIIEYEHNLPSDADDAENQKPPAPQEKANAKAIHPSLSVKKPDAEEESDDEGEGKKLGNR